MPCGWEGNRRSVVALAMRHRLLWFIHIRADGLRKGDEHRALRLHSSWVQHTLPFTKRLAVKSLRRTSDSTRGLRGEPKNAHQT